MDFGKTLQEAVQGVFYWGPRYRIEKIAVISGVVVLSLISTVWALSGSEKANELGAHVDISTGFTGFSVEIVNDGGEDWTDVRVVVDRTLLYSTDEFEDGRSKTLTAEDFDYAYHVPRSWGRHTWEHLADEPKPGVHPDRSYEPSSVQIRANEGRYPEPDDE